MKKLVIGILLVCTLSIIIFIAKSPETGLHFKQETFQTEIGFGYKIYNNEKLLIVQRYIPAIQNKLSFKSHEDAEKVANLMIEKLEQHRSPNISLSDLYEAQIIW